MTPIEAFVNWLGGRVPGYQPTRGLWQESSADTENRFLSIWASPAGAPSGDAASINIRTVMTGRRQSPQDTIEVERAIQKLASDSIEDFRTDCIANIRPMGVPNGPFFTEENRVYYELNFEILMRI